MFWTSYLLAVLAIVLAWPVPILLSRAQWPARSPFTAMLLWQAIALAGGLSMIGAMLVYGLEPVGDNLLAGLTALAGMVFHNAPTTELGFWHIFALSAAGAPDGPPRLHPAADLLQDPAATAAAPRTAGPARLAVR